MNIQSFYFSYMLDKFKNTYQKMTYQNQNRRNHCKLIKFLLSIFVK